MILLVTAAAVLALLAAAIAAAPLLLQQPFGSQTGTGMWVAHLARVWGSSLTVALAVGVIAAVLLASRHARCWGRALLVVPVAVVLAAAWLARENPFEWMFNAVAQPAFVAAADATFVAPADLVIAVSRDGDAAAFPIRQLAYHHVVNDRIAGTPAVVTY
jgi:hypothetical protein